VVARVLLVRGLGAKQVGQLGAGVVRALVAQAGDVELELLQALLVSAKSTGRNTSSTPIFSRLRTQGVTTRAPASLLSRYSKRSGAPWALRKAPSRYSHPASLSSAWAWRKLARRLLSPSVRGGAAMGPKVAAGSCARQGASTASSAASGAPWAWQSVLPKMPCTRA
jgi:hypothetical protein